MNDEMRWEDQKALNLIAKKLCPECGQDSLLWDENVQIRFCVNCTWNEHDEV